MTDRPNDQRPQLNLNAALALVVIVVGIPLALRLRWLPLAASADSPAIVVFDTWRARVCIFSGCTATSWLDWVISLVVAVGVVWLALVLLRVRAR